jgi:hypothetical protein
MGMFREEKIPHFIKDVTVIDIHSESSPLVTIKVECSSFTSMSCFNDEVTKAFSGLIQKDNLTSQIKKMQRKKCAGFSTKTSYSVAKVNEQLYLNSPNILSIDEPLVWKRTIHECVALHLVRKLLTYTYVIYIDNAPPRNIYPPWSSRRMHKVCGRLGNHFQFQSVFD